MNGIAFIVNNSCPMRVFHIKRNPNDDDISDLNDICIAMSDEYNEHFLVYLNDNEFKKLELFMK